MSRKRKELSHEEIWDDSALLASWDEALEEYKVRHLSSTFAVAETHQLYHSIHAKGQRVEDVIADFQRNGDSVANIEIDHQVAEDGTRADEEGEWEEPMQDNAPANAMLEHSRVEESVAATAPQTQAGLTDFPENLAAHGNDDDPLKQLMMSWYWAGYYTGFYQGQQRIDAAQDNKK